MEPARQIDPVYDDTDSEEAVTRPNLRALEGGNETSEPRRGHLSAVPDNDELRSGEEAGASGITDGMALGAEAGLLAGAAAGAGESFFNPADSARSFLSGRITRKKGIAGGITGLLVGGGIFFFMGIASGPLQLIHYGQLLQNITPFQHQQSAADGRLGKLIRWAKTKDVGETRLSKLGSLMNQKIQTDFAAEGIKVNTNSVGQITTVEIDPSKNSQYGNMSNDEAKAAIAADNGLDPGKVFGNKANTYKFNIKDMNISAKRNFINGLIDDQDLGKIASAVRFRTLTKYYNAPSWLHPLKRLSASADQKVADRLAAAKTNEDSRLKGLTEKTDKIKALNESVKGKIKPGALKTAGGVLVASAAICMAKDIVHDVPDINRGNVVIPAMESAGDAMAIGSQVMSGQDIDINTVGAAVSNFKSSDGTTPWQSVGIQDLEGATNPSGTPINSGVAQAFSSGSDEASIEKALDSSGAGALCNPISQVLQGVAGVALLFTGAGGVIEKGVQLGVSFGVGVAIGALTSYITKILADTPITGVPHQGGAGGNVDALGDIELANTSSRAMGGVQLSPAQVSILDSSDTSQRFSDESIADQLFNVNDYRSVASRFIDSQNPDPYQNVASMFGSMFTGFTHMGSAFSSVASALLPHASAAPSTPYGLGVPESGWSQADLDNPLVDDPYANGEAAAALFDGNVGDGKQSYIDKAKTCFGVTIAKDSDGKWGAVGTDDINPTSADYTSANCGDTSDNWLRVRSFIHDTSIMEGYACYALDDAESCTDDGFDASTDGGGTATSPVDTSTYQNPLRNVTGLTPMRIDEGVDYGGDGPVYAIGNGKVVYSNSASGWPGPGSTSGHDTPGTYIAYTLSDGPAAGKTVYVAENCTDIQVKVGDTVNANSILCTMHNANPYIETGWSSATSDTALARSVYHEGAVTAYGVNFSKLLKSVGAQEGTGDQSSALGTLPAGWPSW